MGLPCAAAAHAGRGAGRGRHPGKFSVAACVGSGVAALARVTVVVPCYNYGQFLEACVQSALDQEGVDVDVLVLNDASTDDSAQVAGRLAARDGRVTLIDHAHNNGHVPTFNEGLSKATGKYIVLISADDMLTPGALARATAVMEARPAVGLVYGHPRVIYDATVPPARTAGRVRVWRGIDWVHAQCRRGLSCIYSPEACVRASVQHAVGGYTPSLPHAGDLEMWLRIAAVSDIARVGSDQAYRRMHGGGMMETRFAGLLTDLCGRREAYESFFLGSGARLPRAEQDHALARRRLAAEALARVCARLREGDSLSDELAEYVSFAVEVQGPDIVHSRAWREYRHLLTGRRQRWSRLGRSYLAARRDLDNRYRWYRWRLTGV